MKEGEADAFEELYQSYYQKLSLYAFQFLKELEPSQDIVQGVIIKLWEKRENLQLHDNIEAYLYKAVKNACFNDLRHRKVVEQYADHILCQEEFFDNGYDILTVELAAKIDTALGHLTAQQKIIFELSREQGKTYKEIATELDTTVKNVEYHMSNALKTLRAFMNNYLKSVIIFLSVITRVLPF